MRPLGMDKGLKQNLFLSILALSSLVISLFVLFPFAMSAEEEGFSKLISSILFYLLQLLSFIMTFLIIGKSMILIQLKQNHGYIGLLIGLLLVLVFVFEAAWLIRKIP
ncbi:hypothetical protein [Fontibacter flavus]|uniref:Cytochrome C oxidase subunit IV n=1 Tax=Fontibacter flavus TaxID=654838 RepID=A0ABV6FTP1_9BACT